MPKMPRTRAKALPAGMAKTSLAPLEDCGEEEEEVPEELAEVSLDEEPLLVAVAEELPDEVELPLAVAAAVDDESEEALN